MGQQVWALEPGPRLRLWLPKSSTYSYSIYGWRPSIYALSTYYILEPLGLEGFVVVPSKLQRAVKGCRLRLLGALLGRNQLLNRVFLDHKFLL